MAGYVKVAKTGDLEEGQGSCVEVEGKPIALFNVGGTIYATDHTCPHMGGPLADGTLDGSAVTCPWHGWTFDVSSGKVLRPPTGATITTYPVRIEGDDIEIEV